jgi:hypothetical protein
MYPTVALRVEDGANNKRRSARKVFAPATSAFQVDAGTKLTIIFSEKRIA